MARHFDLAIIGTGSGNSIVDDRFADWDVAILEKGTFGGTCLNFGCIPTKMFVYPADLALSARTAGRLGVRTSYDGVHWREVRDRIFGRIDPISAAGRDWRADANENVTLFEGHARFLDAHTIDTGTGEPITADQVVIAAGGRPAVPGVAGLDEVGYH
ncbi:MAG: FAD-dependent oxidoreductase, partial [Nocardioidaceae bacterium]|nr:FAD-dependent oxidoreductase [Nocardioidaceae bacterium]